MVKNDARYYGLHVAWWMDKNGYSLKDASLFLGVSYQNLTEWCVSGKPVKLDAALKVAKALKMSLGQMCQNLTFKNIERQTMPTADIGDETTEYFFENVVEFAKSYDCSMTDLAGAIGVPRNNLYRSSVGNLNLESALKMAAFMRMDLDELCKKQEVIYNGESEF